MFRFSDPAKAALNLAGQEAKRLRTGYLHPLHVLYGLAAAEGSAAGRLLVERGLDAASLQAEVERALPRDSAWATEDQVPFSPTTKKVLELAFGESGELIGTAHLLLGVVLLEDARFTELLGRRGIGVDAARALVHLDQGRERGDLSLPEGAEPSAGVPPWPLTQEAERVLAAGKREALALGSAVIGPEHLLLGLLADPSAPPAAFLRELGLTLESYRDFLRGD